MDGNLAAIIESRFSDIRRFLGLYSLVLEKRTQIQKCQLGAKLYSEFLNDLRMHPLLAGREHEIPAEIVKAYANEIELIQMLETDLQEEEIILQGQADLVEFQRWNNPDS